MAGKPIVNVVGGRFTRFAIAATTPAESTPPLRKAPLRDVGHHLALDRVGEAVGELVGQGALAPSMVSPGGSRKLCTCGGLSSPTTSTEAAGASRSP